MFLLLDISIHFSFKLPSPKNINKLSDTLDFSKASITNKGFFLSDKCPTEINIFLLEGKSNFFLKVFLLSCLKRSISIPFLIKSIL